MNILFSFKGCKTESSFEEMLFSSTDFNIYTGLKVQGKIDCVVVMGKVMAYGDEFNEEASSRYGH